VEVVQLMLLDIGCRITAVLARVEYKVATLLIATVRDSGGSAADATGYRLQNYCSVIQG
jgi:hypothetical protein